MNNYPHEEEYIQYDQYDINDAEQVTKYRTPHLRNATEKFTNAFNTKNLLIFLTASVILLITGILAIIYPATLKVTTMIVFGAIIITALCLLIIALPHIFELIAMLIGKGFILLIFIVLLIFIKPLIEKGAMRLIEILNNFLN